MDTISKIQTNASLIQLVDAAKAGIIVTIERFEEKDFNRIPFPGSWSAAQVCEHVSKSVHLIGQLIDGKTQATERPPDLHVPFLKGIMENFEVKAKSAEMLLPGTKPHSIEEIGQRLEQEFKGFCDGFRNLDLTETCMDSEFPGVGLMTRLEYISFAVFHTQRHRQQIKNIQKYFNQHR